MNILDYLDWRGDILFSERGLNEVDNLIFSTLAYLDMDDLVPSDDSRSLTIAALYDAYRDAGYDQSDMNVDPLPLLEKAASCERFRGVTVRRYVNEIDVKKEIQFSVVTFCFLPDESYIAFRGTDNTIVGWREDMNLSFLSGTAGQHEAVRYIEQAAAQIKGKIYAGGHSKGGNLAIYGAAFCHPDIRERIVKVFSNDGPGFNQEIASSQSYNALLPKVEKIMPDSSLVGILLTSRARRTVIKSDAKGVMQHHPFSWQVAGTRFERAEELAAGSAFMDDTLSLWVAGLSEENLKVMTNTVFDSLEASGATTISEINKNKRTAYSAILKAMLQVSPDARNDIFDSLRKLLESGKEVAVTKMGKKKELNDPDPTTHNA